MKIIIVIVALFISNYTNSQEIKKYSGKYTEYGYDRDYFYGENASYNYFEENNKRIFNGWFKYSVLEDISSNKYNNIIHISGTYKNNLADGLWTYKRKLDNYSNEYIYYSLNKKYKVFIPYTHASGNYSNGFRVGEWKLTTNDKNGIKEKFIANFDKEKFISEFLFVTDNYSVKGIFNKNGLFDEEWEINWEIENIPFKSIVCFNRGVFAKSLTQNLSNGEIIKNIDNSKFVNSFFKNLEKNKFFSVIDNKIYILKNKKHPINTSYNLIDNYNYNNELKDLDFEILYKSIDFWIFPIITGHEYGSDYNIFSEIRKGIKKVEYKIEKEIISISENELLRLSDSLKIKTQFVQNIIKRKKGELEEKIAKEKWIAEEKRKKEKKEENRQRLIENLVRIDENEKEITKLYINNRKKRHLFSAIKIIKEEYYYGFKLFPSDPNISYADYHNHIIFSNKKLEKSEEYLLIQYKFIRLHKINTKYLEKELNNQTNVKEIIEILNSYDY